MVFGPERRVGVLRGNQVVDLSLAYAKYLKERQSERQPTRLAAVMVPSDLARFIEGGQRTLELADAALDHLFGNVQDQLGPNGEVLLRKASEVRLHAPRPDGSRIACAGGNFADHLAGMAAMGLLPGAGRMSTDEAAKKIRDNGIWGFWKVGRHTAASGEQLPYPSRADRLDYEGEVAIILNREVRDVRATEAKDLVWGVTLLGDWSIRSPAEPTGPLRFGMAKNFDQSCSLGPCIIVGELDPTDVDVETYVNGERRQQFNTRDMVFSFWEYIEYLSQRPDLVPRGHHQWWHGCGHCRRFQSKIGRWKLRSGAVPQAWRRRPDHFACNWRFGGAHRTEAVTKQAGGNVGVNQAVPGHLQPISVMCIDDSDDSLLEDQDAGADVP